MMRKEEDCSPPGPGGLDPQSLADPIPASLAPLGPRMNLAARLLADALSLGREDVAHRLRVMMDETLNAVLMNEDVVLAAEDRGAITAMAGGAPMGAIVDDIPRLQGED